MNIHTATYTGKCPRIGATVIGLIFSSLVSMPVWSNAPDSGDKLRSAWADFLQDLQLAEQMVISDENYPPAATDRVLADGYRYMLAHLNREIEMAIRTDPRFPEFFRSMDMLRKWTGENPDTMYLKAPIDASGYYEVEIEALDTREWYRSSPRVNGPKAPRQVIFQTITNVPGYTGELAEMASCRNQTLDFIEGQSLKPEREGHYKLLIGPSRPSEYTGNFLLSRKELTCRSTGVTATAEATALSVREVFSDWEHEIPLDMSIRRLDSVGSNRPPLDADQMANIIESLGERVARQIRFWNLLMEFPLEMSKDRNGDGVRALPVNSIKQPEPPFTAGGVAGARQLYASGIFELQDDEALVIKMVAPVEPHYVGFQLNNLWMEGPDQQNFVSSLTGAQNPADENNVRYYIIASQDPGVAGWVDTTGLQRGFHAMRFVFKNNPAPEMLPKLTAERVKLDQLTARLPENYPRVSEAERRKEISIRQDHIKMRWRNY